jgi:hypothetical protein
MEQTLAAIMPTGYDAVLATSADESLSCCWTRWFPEKS